MRYPVEMFYVEDPIENDYQVVKTMLWSLYNVLSSSKADNNNISEIHLYYASNDSTNSIKDVLLG